MASMVAKASNGTTNQLLPTMSVKEKGSRNKRKFRADPPLVDPNKIVSSPPNDCSSCEFSNEKFELNPSHGHPCECSMCSTCQDHSDNLKLDLGLSTPSQPREETEAPDEFHDADWSDLTESELEELVLSNLDTIIKGAIKLIVDCGYSEEVATSAVLKSGLCHVFKVTASNIAENALKFLKNGQENDRELYFEDLKQMAKYILAELVCVLREVRPFFSTGDAMWCLLVSDMSLAHACAMVVDMGNSVIRDGNISENNSDPGNSVTSDGNLSGNNSDPCNSVICDGNLGENNLNPVQSQLNTDTKISERDLPNPCKPSPLIDCAPTCQCEKIAASSFSFAYSSKPDIPTILRCPHSVKPKCSLGLSGLHLAKETSSCVGRTHSHGHEEKFGACRKVSGITKREYILRQKSIHLEKSFRTYSCKGFSRTAKISAFGGLILDKKPKSAIDSSCVSIKNVSLKISKTMGVDVPCDKKTHNLLTKVGFPSPVDLEKDNTISISSKTDIPSTLITVSNAPVLSAADTELSLSLPTHTEALNPLVGQWVPHEKKDEMILKLVPKVRELQNQLQEWTEWANQKIMQAARRLSKDKAELKTLRQEKEEVERLKREKQTLEENTMKKLSEMENALYKASGQVERANASLRRLEGENSALRQGMDAAKLRAAESAASCEEVSKRERKTVMQFQSWEKQKALLQEEIVAEKRKLVQLEREMEQAKDLRDKLEARWKLEENAKEQLIIEASSFRKERLQTEASAKSIEDTMKLKAQNSLQKYKDDIEKLEREISQLRLKTDSSRIDALRRGIDGSHSSKLRDSKNSKTFVKMEEYFAIGGVKRERECVMCLSEEMSVVFLPCAHQVVCKTCNEIHEQQGMKDCPSCRSLIERRIFVRYARS